MKRRMMLAVVAVMASLSGGELTKQGGVGFRFDDNKPLAQWREMAELFDRYNFPLMYAVNFRSDDCFDAETQAFLRSLVKRGHEIMDHTPMHSAFYFSVKDPEKYAGKPWVDHISNHVVYCKYVERNDMPEGEKLVPFKGRLQGNTVEIPPELQPRFRRENSMMFYQGKAYIVRPSREDKKVFLATTFWREPADFGTVAQAELIASSKKYGFAASPEGLGAMAELVAARCRAIGIPAPKTWIQPGGFEAFLQADNIRKCLAPHGYICAATYQEAAGKCFCETAPERCAYAMMWGPVDLEDNRPLSVMKAVIADGYARHYVMFGASHMAHRYVKGGWPAFLKRHEELLQWLKESGIPVRTQSQWAERLYYSKTDPAENIFPAWTVDLDKNGRPDGYSGMGKDFRVENGDLIFPHSGTAFRIQGLAGVEKMRNTLRFTVRSGTLSGTISFRHRKRKTGETVKITGPVTVFDVPQDADYADIEVRNDGNEPLILSAASFRVEK